MKTAELGLTQNAWTCLVECEKETCRQAPSKMPGGRLGAYSIWRTLMEMSLENQASVCLPSQSFEILKYISDDPQISSTRYP